MEIGDWKRAIEQTWVVRFPKQRLATFGSTNVAYYVVTEPIYQELNYGKQEGVVRTGRVIAERPTVVTPHYIGNLQGFSTEAYEYFRDVARQVGPNSPGILYQYRKEEGKTDILSGVASEIAMRISADLDRKEDNLSVVMVGADELWDVALLSFMYELTSSSALGNVQDLQARGLLEPQGKFGGVPRVAVSKVEQMFVEVEHGGSPDRLKEELDRWGLFEYFEDRFLNLFRGKRTR